MVRTRRAWGWSVVAAVALIVGCSVGFDENQPNQFYCQSDADCIAPNFACDPVLNQCVRPGAPTPCVDEDRDGYTVDGNPDCANPGQIDCNDGDDNVYPGAPELCDGRDNNCEGQPDEPIGCTSTDFFEVCPNDAPAGTRPTCDNGVCAVVELLAQPGASCNVVSVCSGASYVAQGCP